MASNPEAVTQLYEQIPLAAMQRVSDSYMAWYVNRVTQELDKITGERRSELRDNDAKEASYRPSPNELSAIERLQRSGVTGVDLLDRMVEQGEDWLMLTMRRLDHFERTGLAPKDYSTWCEHALSGAYDWIDHERLGSATSASPAGSSTPAGGAGAAVAARPAAAPAASSSPAAGVPDWLSSRNTPRNAGAAADESTTPVPSVAPRWNDNGYYGPGQQQGASQNGQATPADGDDGKGRNIFRIFSN